MPADAASRARVRMVLTHFDRELFPAAAAIRAAPKSPDARRARKQLQEALISSVRLFAGRGWCLRFEYSLADRELGSASGRVRGGPYVLVSVVAGSLKKQTPTQHEINYNKL